MQQKQAHALRSETRAFDLALAGVSRRSAGYSEVLNGSDGPTRQPLLRKLTLTGNLFASVASGWLR